MNGRDSCPVLAVLEFNQWRNVDLVNILKRLHCDCTRTNGGSEHTLALQISIKKSHLTSQVINNQ